MRRAEVGILRIESISVESCDRGKRLVTVRVDLDDRPETMTVSVLVPNERDESAVREFGIARAKDFARRFAEMPSGLVRAPPQRRTATWRSNIAGPRVITIKSPR
jgi:hypothetical protein